MSESVHGMSKAKRDEQSGKTGLATRSRARTTGILRASPILLLTIALAATAQTPAENDQEAVDPSRETDISEENYRRYMELRDPRLERPAFPTTQFKPTSGLQKMGQLPESSQKHLRNQLRGMILQSGPWSPEELQKPYRFTPSEAARDDAALLRAEMEAWAELVGEYHQREAANLAARQGQSVEAVLAQGQPANQPAQQAQQAQQQGQQQAQQQSQQAAGQNSAPGQESGQTGLGQGQADGQADGAGNGSANASAEQAQAQTQQERRQNRPRPALDDWQDMDGPAARGSSTEGVEQSAADFLRAQGLLEGAAGRSEANMPLRESADGPSNPAENRWGVVNETANEPQGRAGTPAAPGPGRMRTVEPADGAIGTPAPVTAPAVEGATMPLDALDQIRGLDAPARDRAPEARPGDGTAEEGAERGEELDSDGEDSVDTLPRATRERDEEPPTDSDAPPA